jgi:colanic acid biosynthesis glycosyl transferase WcaI
MARLLTLPRSASPKASHHPASQLSAKQSIAILSTFYWPEQTGSSPVMAEFAEFLANSGADVRVATAMPFYPQWRVWPEYRGKIWAREEHSGVRIYRSWHFVRPSPSTIGRILHEVTLSVVALPNMVRALVGAKHCYILVPALSYAFTSSVIAWVLRVPRTLVVHDIMPDTAIELGMLRNPVLIAISSWLARRTYALAGEIHTLGEGMRSRIAGWLPTAKAIRVVPITIDSSELAPVPNDENEFRRRFASGKFTVLYAGNMGQKQDLDILLDTAAAVRGDASVHFHVFGDGAMKGRFLTRREQLKLDNVTHHPLQPRRMLAHMLSGADVVLVPQQAEVIDIVVPSKLMTAMAAGAMIVAACHPASETAELLNRTQSGIAIPPGRADELEKVLRALRSGSVDSQPYRLRARETAQRMFDRASVYGQLLRRG